MKRPLAHEALYNSDTFAAHYHRLVDGGERGEANDSLYAAWDNSANEVRKHDPLGHRALALLHEIEFSKC